MSVETPQALRVLCSCLCVTVGTACGADSTEETGAGGSASSSSGGTLASGGNTSNGGKPTQSGGSSSNESGGSISGGQAAGGQAAGGQASGGENSDLGGAASGGTRSNGGQSNGGTGGAGSSGGDATPSSGCSAEPTMESGSRMLDVGGTERTFLVSIPAGADGEPLPLVFGFHGMMYDAEWVHNGEEPLTGPYFGMLEEADGGAIFVAPQALSGGFSGSDISFVEQIVEALTASLCVDESRIFATGFSMGGIMTARIGCELYQTFRAVAPQSANLPAGCEPTLPALGYLGSHGQQDMVIDLSQGQALRDSYIARNGCDPSPSSADELGCVHYEGCDSDAPVSFCTYQAEHVPGPNAGAYLWRFFSQF